MVRGIGFVLMVVMMIVFAEMIGKASGKSNVIGARANKIITDSMSPLPECPIDLVGENTVLLVEICPSMEAKWNRKVRAVNPTWCSMQYWPEGSVSHSTRVIGAYREGGGKKDIYVWYHDSGKYEDPGILPGAYMFAKQCGIKTVMVPMQSLDPEEPGDKEEELAILNYTKSGGVVWASAGNLRINLSRYNSFPASYPTVGAVGALDCTKEPSRIADYSNYGGKVKYWECGEYADSAGTSFSMPRFVGKRELENKETFIGFIRSLFGLQ